MPDKGNNMKSATAGLNVEHAPEVHTDVADDEESWHAQKDFVPAVRLLQRSLTSARVQAIEEQKCFGWMWEDETGVCPEDGEDGNDLCALRESCQATWNSVQTRRVSRTKKSNGTTAPKIGAVQKLRDLGVTRSKWQGTGKFERKGYEPQDRPVDEMVAAFMAALDHPYELPRIFNAANFKEKYGKYGSCMVAKTASYHSLYHKGVLVARFWTNAAGAAIIDIIPEVVPPMLKASNSQGNNEQGLRVLTKPERVRPKMVKKTKPCSHRIKVRSVAAAAEAAKVFKRKFRWQKKKGV